MKVLFQSRKTLYSVPGGDTTQITKTKEYLEKLGVEVDVSLELNPDVSRYDIVHVFNLMRPQELYLQVKNAKKYGKKVALSTIYGPYEEYEKKARGGILQVLNNLLSITQIEYLKVIARAVLNFEFNKGTVIYLLNGHKRLQRKIIKMVDVFLPNSDSEMLRVAKDFKLKNYNYVAVANAVDVNKFDYERVEISPELEKYRDCVLCVSRIEGRKNQLNIIRACKGLPYKFVFIGKAGANFRKYYEACKAEANDHTFFLGQIEHEKLPQFYKLAKVHILASWMETPGLSSLEAGIMHTNVVVTKKGDTEDYFKKFAFYCEPDDLLSIKDAVVKAFNSSFDNNFLERIRDNYKWEDTARQTFQGYQSIIRVSYGKQSLLR
ncbi:glycosyltransferase family 1 protein [Parabacteroides merdae]|jgi:glycosyltransferase involved in cell wall biosynthesis|uniref:glycosyltransferase family 4 protein n=1 Tax=Phocaeicola sp. TaxID=2773926 RepID=UPI000E5D67FF|nr:glycosyltransferase family 1 protein [Parabacteroides sp. AM18-12LB]RGZ77862.1 glycosyltransferase family 1 protein [Parabacteroides merdae]